MHLNHEDSAIKIDVDKNSSHRSSLEKNGIPKPGQTKIEAPKEADEELSGSVQDLKTLRSKIESTLKSPQIWLILIFGQVVALCYTGLNTFSALITMDGHKAPAFQSLLGYSLCFVIYGSITLLRLGLKRCIKTTIKNAHKYFFLSLFDVLGNYFIVLAYSYANILTCQLLSSWSTVVVVLLSFIFLKVRYKKSQMIGIAMSVLGFVLLVISDFITGKTSNAKNPLKGSLFLLIGATSYAASNILEELVSVQEATYFFTSQIGLYGLLLSGILCCISEIGEIKKLNFASSQFVYYMGFASALCILYSVMPLMMRTASATSYNVSALTSNFWGLVIGLKLFGYKVYWVYILSFIWIMIGQIIYNLFLSPQGESKKPWIEYTETTFKGFGTYSKSVRA